jgi:hypothetical protein
MAEYEAQSAQSAVPSHPGEGANENMTSAQMVALQGMLAALLPEMQSPLSSAAKAQAQHVAPQAANAAAQHTVQQAAVVAQQQAAAVAAHIAHKVAQHAAMAAQQAPLQALARHEEPDAPPVSDEIHKNDLK